MRKQRASEETKEKAAEVRGPLRRWGVLIFFTAVLSVLLAAYVQKKHGLGGEVSLAKRGEFVRRRWDVPCAERGNHPSCDPRTCGRAVIDDFVSIEEALQLKALAAEGLSYGSPGGGPAILDMASGAVTNGDKFANVYEYMKQMKTSFNATLLQTLAAVKKRIRKEVIHQFGIKKLWLTKPTFFARITGGVPPQTMNDEYWHVHIDKLQYGSFVFTGLLYLSDYEVDFDGGVFAFVEQDESGKNYTVEPKMKRLLLFTSGAENPHQVRVVTRGERLVLTIAFTCDQKVSFADKDEVFE